MSRSYCTVAILSFSIGLPFWISILGPRVGHWQDMFNIRNVVLVYPNCDQPCPFSVYVCIGDRRPQGPWGNRRRKRTLEWIGGIGARWDLVAFCFLGRGMADAGNAFYAGTSPA